MNLLGIIAPTVLLFDSRYRFLYIIQKNIIKYSWCFIYFNIRMKSNVVTDFLGWTTEKGCLSPAIRTPSKMMVVGQSNCGKTYFLRNLLKIRPFEHNFFKIYFYYMEDQEIYKTIQNENPEIEFIHGFPEKFPSHEGKHTLVILDDMITELGDGKQIVELFLMGSHHKLVTCIMVSQSLYFNHKKYRLLSLQCNYLILFRSPRDSSQISPLSFQVFPTKPGFIKNVFWKICHEKMFASLFLDLSQQTQDFLRVWSDILENPVVYMWSMPDTETKTA